MSRAGTHTGLLAIVGVVGFLAFVEFTSGVIQGFYVPMMTDIARTLDVHDADVNWLEGTQLMLSALVVPAFAKLGDMIGHKRMLLVATGATALATLAMPFTDSFALFLAAWALQGVYVVWLPLEVALIWIRARRLAESTDARPTELTTRATGLLVAALEFGAIVGAIAGGALVDALPLRIVLLVPGVIVAICFFVVLLGVQETEDLPHGRFDTTGLVLISLALVAFTGGLSLLRVSGPTDPLAWGVAVLGAALVVPFVLWELRQSDPLIDVRMFRSRRLWPLFVTAGLFGMGVLGAQAPLSTFIRTEPEVYGYGLGITGFATSLIIGLYLTSMIAGALLLPLLRRLIAPRLALITACLLMSAGYLLFVPFHDAYGQMATNISIAGLGSGALLAALPATAAAAAPPSQTGVATGLTNSVKTVGGAIASCIFGIALMNGAVAASGAAEATAGSLSGYYVVWLVCGLSPLLAAAALLCAPRRAFTDTYASDERAVSGA